MCGIVGLLSSYAQEEKLTLIHEMNTILRHRGPDDEGYVVLGASGEGIPLKGADTIPELSTLSAAPATWPSAVGVLGHRRLSIVDLTPNGHQPMHDSETGNWLVFVGEIYNHLQLRTELSALGHRFRGQSDTEVILAAYREWGRRCLERFNGMWAFALWDARARRLFCACDRFGEKQLYFISDDEGNFYFASEIRPLLRIPKVSFAIRDELVWDFLCFGLADHTADTFFSPINRLMPGHFLEVEPGCRPFTRRYYTLRFGTDVGPVAPATLSHWAEDYRELLLESVRLRLRGDVPVSSFLSGGLDSPSVVYSANLILAEGDREGTASTVLTTFTNSYTDDSPYDESKLVRQMTSDMDRVQPNFVEASKRCSQANLQELTRIQEQPFHNASILASFRLLQHIHQQGFKVVLTGESGDETLAGYGQVYLGYQLLDLLVAGYFFEGLAELRRWGRSGLIGLAKQFIRTVPHPVRLATYRRYRPVPASMDAEFFHAYSDREQELNENWRGGALHHRLVGDLTQYNLPQLLRHLDRNAMASSIECRLPLLDYRLVEKAIETPASAKIAHGHTKLLLREAMSGRLPDEVVWNRRKLGFGGAEQFWFLDALDIRDFRGTGLERYIDFSRIGAVDRMSPARQEYWLIYSLGLWLIEFFGS